jgi:small subunit ribosomal protein S17
VAERDEVNEAEQPSGTEQPAGDATPTEEPAAEQVPAGEPVEETVAEEEAAAAETVAEEPEVAETIAAEAQPAAAETVAEEPTPAAAEEPPPAPREKRRATRPKTPRPSPSARRAAAKAKAGQRESTVKAPREPKPERQHGRRQERRGVVVSAAMDKTIVVKVDMIKAHPKYKKVIRRSTKFHAHDDANAAKAGDVVRIVETRPLSATKRWRLVEVVEAAK